jgi:lipopolysaccharide heptosyltransferase I
VIRLSAIGDVLFALPAVRALRRAHPGARISWLTEDRAASIVELVSEIDECIVFPRRRFVSGLRSPIRFAPTLADVVRFYRSLRSRRFDVSIDFQSNAKSALAVAAAAAPRRIGFAAKSGREANHRVQTELVDVPAGVRHRMDKDLALLAPLGIGPSHELDFHLEPTDAARQAARAFWSALPGAGPRVVVHPSTSLHGAFKRWSAERFAELCDRLARDEQATIVVSHGPGERQLAESVRRRMREPSWTTPPSCSLIDLAALLGEADLVVGGDTGPLHLAEAAGTRVVILFGPKDPDVYGPRLAGSSAVSARLECSPCRRRACPRAFCLDFVTVDETLAACRSSLASAAGGRTPS